MQLGTIVRIKRPEGFADNGLDVGRVTKSRECPVLLRTELLVEFSDGGQGWYNKFDLVEVSNESQA